VTTNHDLFVRAERVIPGGVNSPVRAFRAVGGTPYFVKRAEGASVWDVEGRRYVDLVQSYGAIIAGHAHPAVLEAVRRAGTTETGAVIKALEGHDFDGLKEGRSYFRAWDHQHVQDVLVGQAYGKELGLGHYQILATVPGDAVAGGIEQNTCRL